MSDVKRIKAKVIMLPTEDNTKIYVGNKTDHIYYSVNPNQMFSYTPQHIYITVSQDVEAIKEGDWAMYLEQATEDAPYKGADPYLVKNIDEVHWYDRKIIATTDPKLTIHTIEELGLGASVDKYTKIPQPSQAFIEKYCKVGGIDEVDVEYEEKEYTEIEKELSINGHDQGLNERELEEYSKTNSLFKLKVDSHNTITIHPIKDSWTGIELLGNQDGGLDQFLMNSTKYSQGDREMILDAIHNWITNNI